MTRALQRIILYARLARLHSLTGAWLLFWPAAWALTIAAPSLNRTLPPQNLFLLFLTGAFLARSAGCVWNDILDRRIDALTPRTKFRPLASGAVSLVEALFLAASLAALAALTLFQLHINAVILGLAATPLALLYPLAKRFTSWPQLVLGFAFAWGALVAWTAALHSFPQLPALLLYASCICWIVAYDAAYALQDAKTDAANNVKSVAVLFGTHTKTLIVVCQTLHVLSLIGAVALAQPIQNPGVVLLALPAAFLARSTKNLRVQSVQSAAKTFRANSSYALLVFLTLILVNASPQIISALRSPLILAVASLATKTPSSIPQ